MIDAQARAHIAILENLLRSISADIKDGGFWRDHSERELSYGAERALQHAAESIDAVLPRTSS